MTRRPGLASRQALIVSRATSVPRRSSCISDSFAKSVDRKPLSVILVLANRSAVKAGSSLRISRPGIRYLAAVKIKLSQKFHPFKRLERLIVHVGVGHLKHGHVLFLFQVRGRLRV